MKTLTILGLMLAATTSVAAAQQTPQPKTAKPAIPADQRPPKGMCRIWLKDVPSAQQPAATECAVAVKNCPPNGQVIFGDTDETKVKVKQPAATPETAKKSVPAPPPVTTRPPVVRKPPA